MGYVIYNKTSFHRFRTPSGKETFSTEPAAKATLTKMVTSDVLKREDWVVADYDTWRAAEPMVVTYSIFDLKKERPIQIRASEKGGCCDPGTERYHTM